MVLYRTTRSHSSFLALLAIYYLSGWQSVLQLKIKIDVPQLKLYFHKVGMKIIIAKVALTYYLAREMKKKSTFACGVRSSAFFLKSLLFLLFSFLMRKQRRRRTRDIHHHQPPVNNRVSFVRYVP